MSGKYGLKQVILVCTVDICIVLSLSVVYIIYILKKVNEQTSLNIVFAPVSSYQISELYVYVKRVTTYGLRLNFNRMI